MKMLQGCLYINVLFNNPRAEKQACRFLLNTQLLKVPGELLQSQLIVVLKGGGLCVREDILSHFGFKKWKNANRRKDKA